MRSLVLGIQIVWERGCNHHKASGSYKCGEHKYPKLTKPAHVENEYLFQCCVRDGPLENFLGGGGGGEVKKIFAQAGVAQGKIKWKK